jgi:hypothetical protein
MGLSMADVTVHIDESLDLVRREELRSSLCGLPGVVDVRTREATPHLMVVQYNPYTLKSDDILHTIACRGLHAELIGL